MSRIVKRASGSLAALTLLLAVAGRSEAGLVTFNLSGTVLALDDPASALGGSITAGDPVAGSYTFNPASRDSDPDPEVGNYYHRGAPSGIRLGIGGLAFESNPFAPNFLIQVLDTPRTDYYNLYGFVNQPVLPGATVDLIKLSLMDNSASVFADDGLTGLPPDLSRFDTQFSFIRGHTGPGGTGNIYTILIRLDSLEPGGVTALPEPSTLVMAAGGTLMGLGCWYRRRGTRRRP